MTITKIEHGIHGDNTFANPIGPHIVVEMTCARMTSRSKKKKYPYEHGALVVRKRNGHGYLEIGIAFPGKSRAWLHFEVDPRDLQALSAVIETTHRRQLR